MFIKKMRKCNELYKLIIVLSILSFVQYGECVRCYQCATSEDPEGQDNCGAYKKFVKEEHIPIECNSDESHTPGTFCMKITKQGSKGFIWDGRWRHVVRRCASVADTGVTGVCNWGIDYNGDFWEECYCSSDSCNSSTTLFSYKHIYIALFAALLLTLRT